MKVSFKTNNKPDRNGEDRIMLVVSHKGFPKPIKRSTEIKVSVKLEHWDAVAKKIKKGDKQQDTKNNRLSDLKTQIEKIPIVFQAIGKQITFEEAERTIDEIISKVLGREIIVKEPERKPSDFFAFAKQTLQRRKDNFTHGTYRLLNDTVNKVREFSPKLDMNDMGLDWFEAFFRYLSSERAKRTIRLPDGEIRHLKNLSPVTIGRHQRGIITILNEAQARKRATNFENYDYKLLPPDVEENPDAKHIYLFESEIDFFYKHRFTKEQNREAEARDLMVLYCCTALRFEDAYRISVEGDFLHLLPKKVHKKTGKQIIPYTIYPYVAKILKKYNDKLPRFTNSDFNKYVRKAAEIAGLNRVDFGQPIYELISSHTGRRSLCTNLYIHHKWPASYVMLFSGHKTERDFYKYIKAKPHEIAQTVLEFHISKQRYT